MPHHLLLLLALLLALLYTTAVRADSPAGVIIRVGPDAGDFRGADSTALQQAADELARRAPKGSGLLQIAAGTYTMYDSLHLRVPMTVRGAGRQTILIKCPQVRTRLQQDFDLSEYVALVADPAGLRVGMGVTFKDKKQQGAWGPSVRTIVAIEGHAIKVDRRPERDYSFQDEAWLQNSFPIISAREVDGVVIEDLVADGNGAQNPDIRLDGCRAGAIYLHEAKRCTIRRCVGRNFSGDGISWQTTDEILVEDCESYGNADLGLHPGTGSPRTTVRNCHSHDNGNIGLFLCWGVKFGRFENNLLENNGRFGISIGHKDSDNLFLNNQVRGNGVAGVDFRQELEATAGHRCTFRQNVIENNGRPGQEGIGVRILGPVRDTVLEANTIRDTHSGKDRTQGPTVEIGPHAGTVTIATDNKLDGDVHDLRPAKP